MYVCADCNKTITKSASVKVADGDLRLCTKCSKVLIDRLLSSNFEFEKGSTQHYEAWQRAVNHNIRLNEQLIQATEDYMKQAERVVELENKIGSMMAEDRNKPDRT